MDAEHKQLVEYMNQLHTNVENKASKAILQKSLTDLFNYTLKHFKDEEELFKKIPNYSFKNAHVKIHEDLIAKLKTYAATFEKTGTFPPDFFVFLKVWLTAHIAGIDMKYSNALYNKAA